MLYSECSHDVALDPGVSSHLCAAQLSACAPDLNLRVTEQVSPAASLITLQQEERGPGH